MASTIRVLLIEEPKYRQELQRAFNVDGLSLVAEAGFGTEAITTALDCRPDVIAVSFEEPIARPMRVIESLSAALPSVGIVALSSMNDRSVMRKAMRAGARDYLIKPVAPRELQSAIAAVHEAELKKQSFSEPTRQTSLQRGDVLVVFGPKGGIGKTTLAINLAAGIAAETNQRVALVDLDAQMGDVALLMSINPERNIADAAMNAHGLEPELLQGLLHNDESRVQVLPSPPLPEESAEITGAEIGQILDALAKTFDYVVVDTSPALNDMSVTALERATLVLLVTTPEMQSIKRTKIALNVLLDDWKLPEDRVKLVVNDPYGMNGKQIENIEDAVQYPVFWRVPYDTAVSQSVKSGRPCLETNQNSRFSRSILDLTRGICGLKQPTRGLFAALLGRA